MATDTTKLRELAQSLSGGDAPHLVWRAAEEIDALRAERDRMREALERYVEDLERSIVIESQEFNLVKMLSPRIFIDGNQWCVLYGEDLMSGVAGFGESPILAVYDFNKAWHKKLSSSGDLT